MKSESSNFTGRRIATLMASAVALLLCGTLLYTSKIGGAKNGSVSIQSEVLAYSQSILSLKKKKDDESAELTEVDGVVYSDYQFAFSATSSGTSTWTSVCTSTSGQYVYALDGSVGIISVSNDYGSSFTKYTPSSSLSVTWTRVECPVGKSALIQGTSSTTAAYLFSTSDGGKTWSQATTGTITGTGWTWNSLSVSTDMNSVIATDNAARIYVKLASKSYYTSYGATELYCSGSCVGTIAAYSPDGNMFIIAETGYSVGKVYLGYTYCSGACIPIVGSSGLTTYSNYKSIAINSDNTRVVIAGVDLVVTGKCVAYSGGVNSGSPSCTWSATSPTSGSMNWYSLYFATSDSVNEFVVGAVASSTTGYGMVSTDYGASWFSQKGLVNANIRKIAIASDLSTMYVAVYSSSVYKAVAGSPTPAPSAVPSVATPTTSRPTWAPSKAGELSWSLTNSISADWMDIACTSEGSRVVAASSDGKLYTSSDYGNTFSSVTSPITAITSVAIASDSTSSSTAAVIMVGATAGYVYLSLNGGSSFTTVSTYYSNGAATSLPWGTWYVAAGAASGVVYYYIASKTGTVYYAAGASTSSSLYLYKSSISTASSFGSIACSSTGQYAAAAATSSSGSAVSGTGGFIFISSDYGKTWAQKYQAGNQVQNYFAVSMSADGSKLMATSNSGTYTYTYYSYDYGSSWYSLGYSYMGACAISNSGTGAMGYYSSDYLYAATGMTKSSGASVISQQSLGKASYKAVATSSDGLYMYAGASNGKIYRSTVLPTMAPTPSPSTATTGKPSTIAPTKPTRSPTAAQTPAPTTTAPSANPTFAPTALPTQPTAKPTVLPTFPPTAVPSKPSAKPSPIPTSLPTKKPTPAPSSKPSSNPTMTPTSAPSTTLVTGDFISAGSGYSVTIGTMSADGTKAYAITRVLVNNVLGMYLLTSTNKGATWTVGSYSLCKTATAQLVQTTSDGKNVIVLCSYASSGYTGYPSIEISSNSGSSFTRSYGGGWSSWQYFYPTNLAMSDDAMTIYMVASGGVNGRAAPYVLISTDSGTTFGYPSLGGVTAYSQPKMVSICTDSSGTNVLFSMGASASVYISTDKLATYKASPAFYVTGTTTPYYSVVACSSDFKYLAASQSGGYIIYSKDSGANWSKGDISANGLNSYISMSIGSSGYLVAATSKALYTSDNTGAYITKQPSSGITSTNLGTYYSVAASSDAKYIVAFGNLYSAPNYVYDYKIWASPGYGGVPSAQPTLLPSAVPSEEPTYTSRRVLEQKKESVAASVVVANNEKIRALQTDTSSEMFVFGTYSVSPSANYQAVCVSDTGDVITAAITDGALWTSTDSGLTWSTSIDTTSDWSDLACSGDGKSIVAASNDGAVYYSVNAGLSWAQSTTESSYQYISIASTRLDYSIAHSHSYHLALP